MKFLILGLFALAALAAEPQIIPLWPGLPPGSESWNYPEQEVVGPKDDLRRVSNVTRPTLIVYLPSPATANGTGIVVCPGGGYRILAIDHEGHEVAHWLNSLGVAAFVLKYRVMRTGDAGEKDPAVMAERRKTVMPLLAEDGRQAVRLVRANAAKWGVAPDRIGIMGFSAGGYVTSAVSLKHDAESRPNFAAPVYPATPEDVTAPADAPPLFLVHADDDKTVPPIKHSVRLYTSWKAAGAPAEMHIYASGGHGFGMRKRGGGVDTWTDRFRDWLDGLGMLKKAPR